VRLPDAPMPAKPPTIEKVPVPCDRCHGTGINAGIECSECGGKGHRVVIGGKMAAPTKPPERRKRWRGKPANRR
jgi:DnaJ-class molecular chaperone